MAPPYKAERSDIFVGIESDQKTEATLSRYPGFLKGEQEVPDPEQEWIEERVVGGDRDVFQFQRGPQSFEGGSFNIVPYDGWPLAWLLQAESTSGTDPTTHTLTPQSSETVTTATVEANYSGATGQDDFSRAFVGCAPETGTISVNNEEELMLELDVTALGITSDSTDGSRTKTTGISYPDREVWTFNKVNSNLSIFGTSFARVEDFSLEVSNNLEAARYVEDTETPEPFEMIFGNAEYSLDLDIAIEDDSIYQELAGPSDGGFDMSITFEKASGTETLKLEGSNCRMTEAPHTIPEDGKVTVSPSITPRTTTITVKDDTTSGTGYLA